MCDVCKLGYVTRYGHKMLENFPPKMATLFIDGSVTLLVPDMYKRAKLNILCLAIVDFFVSSENKQCFVLVPSLPTEGVDVFVALILFIS